MNKEVMSQSIMVKCNADKFAKYILRDGKTKNVTQFRLIGIVGERTQLDINGCFDKGKTYYTRYKLILSFSVMLCFNFGNKRLTFIIYTSLDDQIANNFKIQLNLEVIEDITAHYIELESLLGIFYYIIYDM